MGRHSNVSVETGIEEGLGFNYRVMDFNVDWEIREMLADIRHLQRPTVDSPIW